MPAEWTGGELADVAVVDVGAADEVGGGGGGDASGSAWNECGVSGEITQLVIAVDGAVRGQDSQETEAAAEWGFVWERAHKLNRWLFWFRCSAVSPPPSRKIACAYFTNRLLGGRRREREVKANLLVS